MKKKIILWILSLVLCLSASIPMTGFADTEENQQICTAPEENLTPEPKPITTGETEEPESSLTPEAETNTQKPEIKAVGEVTDVKATGISYKTIKLRWNKAKNAEGYQIYRYSKKKKRYVQIKTLSASASKFKNTKLRSNKAYQYKVRAFNVSTDGKTKHGKFSKKISAKTKMSGSQKIIAKAKTRLGCPYRGGASGPKAFDCSGFVYWTYKNAQVKTKKKVIRTSSAGMYASLKKYKVATGLSGIKKAKKGDIILFKRGGSFSHAAIYYGGGKIIHARSSQGITIQSIKQLHNSGTRVAVIIRVVKK